MDTKLKRFNISALKKAVALILCILCVAGCAFQVLTSLWDVNESDLYDRSFHDAFFYSGKRLDKLDITDTKTFKHHFENYTQLLSDMIGIYGDGSKEDYEAWKKSIEESNELNKRIYKQNLINHVIGDYFLTYLDLVEDGTVEPLGFIQASEYSGENRDLEAASVNGDVDYYELCVRGSTHHIGVTVPEEVKKKAEELKADGVFEINNYYKVIDYDYENGYDDIVAAYQPGYYAFKINDDVLWDRLYFSDILRKDYYGSAKEFKDGYDRYAKRMAEKYPSGIYYIKDDSGRAFTNISSLSEKSTIEELKKTFNQAGFYTLADAGDSFFMLPDGNYYSHSTFGDDSYYYDYEDATYYYATTMHTTTLPVAESTTLAPQVSAPTVPTEVTNRNGEIVSTSVTVTIPEATTRLPVVEADSTPFINENSEEWICYVGVDMYSEGFPDTDRFRTTASQIEQAKELILDFAITCGILALLFVACFIYLVVKSGRRKDSDEIYLMKTDKMFTDWRIILDCLLGWGIFGLFVLAVEEFEYYNAYQQFTVVVTVLVAAFFAVVLDLVLFITRQIKNRSIFRQLFPVWLCRNCFGFYKGKVKPYTDEKFLYTKNFSKGTLIRLGVVVATNVILACASTYEMAENGTCFLLVILLGFDVAVLVWMIRLIGGIRRIFSALDEIRQGNYSVQINTYALTPTLRETAVKVMNLRDGLKNAVDEAVKQEQTKTELITNVSHDLKTPLTSIINYVELMKKCEINDEDAKEYLGVLGEKSDRLKKLIEDLVEASKASTGNVKVDFVEVSLNEMVSQLLGEHADALEKRKLNVIADMPERNLTVKADGKLLYRVMENLIVNVEKYSLYGTRVYVTVKEENGYGTVTFKNISEQPLNITAEQLKERFVRGDESRSTEGNGLGLSIAQSLCTVQGGELEIVINGDLFTAKVRLKK